MSVERGRLLLNEVFADGASFFLKISLQVYMLGVLLPGFLAAAVAACKCFAHSSLGDFDLNSY